VPPILLPQVCTAYPTHSHSVSLFSCWHHTLSTTTAGVRAQPLTQGTLSHSLTLSLTTGTGKDVSWPEALACHHVLTRRHNEVDLQAWRGQVRNDARSAQRGTSTALVVCDVTQCVTECVTQCVTMWCDGVVSRGVVWHGTARQHCACLLNSAALKSLQHVLHG
jgi:hypothetical protein